MYLSRVRVAPEGLDANAFYSVFQGNAYGNHQLLWKLFPDAVERPFLFRQEFEHETASIDSSRGMPLFYVLSDTEPTPVPRLLSCESKPFEPKLVTGQALAFKLRANPIIARREEGRKNARRHDVLMDAKKSGQSAGYSAEQIQREMDAAARGWLANETRSQSAGYRLTGTPQATGYRQHSYRRKGGNIRFSSVDYEGRLEVTDPEWFKYTLAQGIGRSRAFGCGLWLLRPL